MCCCRSRRCWGSSRCSSCSSCCRNCRRAPSSFVSWCHAWFSLERRMQYRSLDIAGSLCFLQSIWPVGSGVSGACLSWRTRALSLLFTYFSSAAFYTGEPWLSTLSKGVIAGHLGYAVDFRRTIGVGDCVEHVCASVPIRRLGVYGC